MSTTDLNFIKIYSASKLCMPELALMFTMQRLQIGFEVVQLVGVGCEQLVDYVLA